MKSNIFLLSVIIFSLSLFTACQKESLEDMDVLTSETTELTATTDLSEDSTTPTRNIDDPQIAQSRSGHCYYQAWFKRPFNQKNYRAGSDIYVLMGTKNHHHIEYMKLYLNGEYVGKESHSPYEWGRPHGNGDHKLRNLHPGEYKLKVEIKDKCGHYDYKYLTFYVGKHYNHCNYNTWFETPKHCSYYKKGEDVYVKVKAENKHHIEYIRLYINDEPIRKELHSPYEWGRPHGTGDHYLRNMQRGTYKLKAEIKDKCGDVHYQYTTFYVY